MAIQQPTSSSPLDSPDHSLSHRVFANDDAAPVQSVVVDSAGRVGVATATPTEKLTVAGNMLLSGTFPYLSLTPSGWGTTSYIQAGVNQESNASGDYLTTIVPSGKGFSFTQGTLPLAVILPGGNVGVGTTAPEHKLQVAADGVRGSGGAGGQIVASGATNINKRLNIGYDTTSDYGYVEAAIVGSSWRNLVLQGSGGNVGIGTANPLALLTVGGTQAGNAGMEVVPGSSIVIQAYNRTAGAYASLTFDSSISAFRSSATSGNLTTFRAATATTLAAATVGAVFDYSTSFTNAAQNFTGVSLTTAAVTAAAGNTLRGITVAPGAITNASGTTTYRGVQITMPNITQTAGTLTATGLYIAAGTVTSGTAYALITEANAGNVGIGMTPTENLSVSGTLIGLHSVANANIIIDRGGTNRLGSMTYSTAGAANWYTGMPDSDIRGDGTEYFIGTSNSDPKLWIETTGNVGIGTDAPTELLDINSDTLRLRTAKTPASATATGAAGEICWDADYVYVCVATDTWKRSALTTW